MPGQRHDLDEALSDAGDNDGLLPPSPAQTSAAMADTQQQQRQHSLYGRPRKIWVVAS
jgi:hypothetical protein